MREITSFLVWVVAVAIAATAINFVATFLGATADIAVLLSCFPLIVALAIGMSEDVHQAGAAVIKISVWFYGAFFALLLTAYLLSLIV